MGCPEQYNCNGFHKYVQAFLRQSAEVCPSEAEKIHNFKRGLSSALQNAVLLDTTTKEPWTEFAPLLKVATSFANELLGRKTHGTQPPANAANAGRGRDNGKSQKKRSASQGSGPSRPRSASAGSSESKQAKRRTKWCRAEKRCDNCFQKGHFRADCPDTATEAERQQALTEFGAWQKSEAKGKAKAFPRKDFQK